MRQKYILFLFPVLLCFYSGCASSDSVKDSAQEPQSEIQYPAPDPEIAGLLDTYRDTLDQVMGRRIAVVKDTIRFDRPESPLGNLVSDAIRYRAGSELGRFVNIGIIGEISFRLFLTPGELTLGEVMEFMPYDNHLVVLTLPGDKVAELAHQVAALGGAPVSGLRFRINEGRAAGILVNSQVLDRNREYLVATSSWVANGGDQFPAVWDYTDRIDLTNVDVRELYLDYFRSRREIYPVTDGRLR